MASAIRYLLDTNTTFWYTVNSQKLPTDIREDIAFGCSFVSVFSMQELAILITLNKIKIKGIKELVDIPKLKSHCCARYFSTLHANKFR